MKTSLIIISNVARKKRGKNASLDRLKLDQLGPVRRLNVMEK